MFIILRRTRPASASLCRDSLKRINEKVHWSIYSTRFFGISNNSRSVGLLRLTKGKGEENSRSQYLATGLSAVLGIGLASYLLREKRRDFKMIQCANALNSEDENNSEIKPNENLQKRKLSERFNFIADAVETAAPAVVYVQVLWMYMKEIILGY